jgi:flagellar hook assembly protein FlgD
VALLLAGTATGMVVTQRLRDEGPVASNIALKIRPEGRYRVCFQLTRDDTVRVAMVSSADQVVRVLADKPLQGGSGKEEAHCFDWDATDDSGLPVPPDRYHLRIELQETDRTAVSGERLRIGMP